MVTKHERIKATAVDIILFALFLLSLIYCYKSRKTINVAKISNTNFTVLDPYASSVIVDDKYEQLLNITNFTFKINSQQCKNFPAGLLLLIIVTSDPRNLEERNAIRNTWGQNVDATKVVFFFGDTADKTISKRIRNENLKYGDIVQGNFVDAYKNMTYKHIMALKWVVHHCPTVKYVLKTDDDILVNIHELRHFLARELSPWGARDLIMCQALSRSPAQRGESKWKVTKEEFAPQYYPRYCAGWAILYSRDVISRLLITSQFTPYFWIDDVYVTGFCAEKAGVPRTDIDSLTLTDEMAEVLQTQGSQKLGTFLLGPFNIDPDTIIELWKLIPKTKDLNR